MKDPIYSSPTRYSAGRSSSWAFHKAVVGLVVTNSVLFGVWLLVMFSWKSEESDSLDQMISNALQRLPGLYILIPSLLNVPGT